MMWQPIETAPPDTAILVYGFGFDVAHYNSFLRMWIGYGRETPDTSMLNVNKPTHWMPLPEPPK